MSEPPIKSPDSAPEQTTDSERTKQVTVAGLTVGVSAFFGMVVLGGSGTWPTAFGVAAVMAGVAVVCHLILRKDK